ncbi:hypothetical protein HBI70_057410 [Parastagonospora nodorum]|nr:hypothetical protein HBH82_121030 [Parastagonospora nodorum]KAH4710186.1 hypothetical protein HBH67_041280 [Parastagonospora nodorum]KAH4735073.1 hypothetical protein HBH78_003220 [Parastagonospora nodorum]KAH4783864.1 hypothetical protein HBH62_100690 [Parastagonospora nodorum]KAH4808240.1 hypothetical protein HBH63_058590 [Parastagonospora nodorum]
MFIRLVVPALLASAVAAGSLFVDRSYIVQVAPGGNVAEILSDFPADIRLNLTSEIFSGCSITFRQGVNEAEELARLLAKDQVVQAWRNKRIAGQDSKNVPIAPGVPAKLKSRQTFKRNPMKDTFSPHVMTQVDQLHAKGITGKGARIALLDFGVDYTHYALGGCFGKPECLFPKGYDFTGNDYHGGSSDDDVPHPGPDPMDSCAGYGTHAAGIIAAQKNEHGFVGVAPDAKIYPYRVFSCDGSTSEDVLVAGFLRAHSDGANIISCSMAAQAGWSEYTNAVILSRMVAEGIIVTFTAGDDGNYGQFFAEDPAGGKGVAAIASFDNTVQPWLESRSRYTVNNGQVQDFRYAVGEPAKWVRGKLPLWTPSSNPSGANVGCTPFPDTTPDLSEKIVIMRRGGCGFGDKLQNAIDKGAKYVMIYNNAPGAVSLQEGSFNLSAVGMVEAAIGENWVRALAAGKTITLDMSDPHDGPSQVVETPNTLTGGSVSSFSSWGPTYEADMKPQFGAPGANILSTFPVALGSFATISGSGRACYHAAGIYALLAEARGTYDPIVLQNLLAATAKPARINVNNVFGSSLAPVAQQGAGLLQAYDAAYAVTVLSASGLSFNDTVNLVDESFTISNTGHKAITYELDVISSATAYTFSTSTSPDTFPGLKIDNSYATVHLSTYKTTVAAGGKQTIIVKVTPPRIDASRLPVYGGYIRLNATNGETLSLPYQGIVGDLSSHVVLNSTALQTLRESPSGDFVPVTPQNSVFKLSHKDQSSDDTPSLFFYLSLGSARIYFDVVSVGNQSRVIGEASEAWTYLARDYPYFFRWDGRLKNHTAVADGDYKLRVRAARIIGKAERNLYDVVESKVFSIRWK